MNKLFPCFIASIAAVGALALAGCVKDEPALENGHFPISAPVVQEDAGLGDEPIAARFTQFAVIGEPGGLAGTAWRDGGTWTFSGEGRCVAPCVIGGLCPINSGASLRFEGDLNLRTPIVSYSLRKDAGKTDLLASWTEMEEIGENVPFVFRHCLSQVRLVFVSDMPNWRDYWAVDQARLCTNWLSGELRYAGSVPAWDATEVENYWISMPEAEYGEGGQDVFVTEPACIIGNAGPLYVSFNTYEMMEGAALPTWQHRISIPSFKIRPGFSYDVYIYLTEANMKANHEATGDFGEGLQTDAPNIATKVHASQKWRYDFSVIGG